MPACRALFLRASAALLLATALAAQAADDSAARRDKEQLQRTRSALREATAQREALQAEKAAWESERGRLNQKTAQAQAQARVARERQEHAQASQLQALKDENLYLEVLVSALRDQQAESDRRASETTAALGAQLAITQRELQERAAVARAVVQILERSTGALNTAQASNQQMQAVGQKAIEQLRQEMGTRELSLTDPLGLRAVRRENLADALRENLEQAQTQTQTPAAKAR